MCSCLRETEDELEKIGYTGAQLSSAFVQIGGAIKVRTYTNANYEVETKTGKKKIKKIPVTHTYCPFCGEKYE